MYVTRDIPDTTQESIVNVLSFISISSLAYFSTLSQVQSMSYTPSVKLWGNTFVFSM